MNQEIYHPRNLFFSRLISSLIYPIYRGFYPLPSNNDIGKYEIKKILVTEYHCIGDVLMIIPALRLIKSSFPNAELTLLTNSDASELLENFKLADNIISYDFPWTGKKGKTNYQKVWNFAKKLKEEKFDLGIDFKGDFRNLIFLWKTRSRYRLGFNGTGGAYLLTHSFPFPFKIHQSDRAVQLLQLFELNQKIDKSLINIVPNIFDKKKFIVLHPGANHRARQWSVKNWLKLIKLMNNTHKIALVKTDDSKNLVSIILKNFPEIYIFSGSLLRFGQWLQNQKLLIGMDSMAVHLAGVLGIPSIAIFGKQNPKLTGPKYNNSTFLSPDKPCSHRVDHWRLCQYCTNSITPEAVIKKIKSMKNYI